MHPATILHEAQKPYSVSDRLESLAEQHPLVSEALITISGSVRHNRNSVGGAGRDENNAALRIRSGKCLILHGAVFGPGSGYGAPGLTWLKRKWPDERLNHAG